MARNYLTYAAGVMALILAAGCETTKPAATRPAVGAGGAEENGVAATAPVAADKTAMAATGPGVSATQGALAGTVSPEMLEALRQLSADDFQTRQQAVAKLQQAMSKHFQQMVLVQELMLKIQDNLAQQLREMTLSADTGGQARVASLMEFNQALSRWAIDVLAMPTEKREEMLKWGLSPEGYPLVVRAYSRKEDVRAAVAKDLAKINNDSTIWMLGELLDDTEREVSLCAMDAVWDKTPTGQMIDVLWNKAVGAVLQQYRPRQARARTVNVHGRMVQVYDQDYNYTMRLQDADVAADVLIHWKSPVVGDRLNSLFKEMSTSIRDPNDYRWRIISPNYGEGGKTLARLIESYKPKEAFPFVFNVLKSTMQDGYVNQFNNVNYWQSTRVDAAVLLARMTNQEPEDYKLEKLTNFGDRWMLKVNSKQGDNAGAMKEKGQMIRQMLIWWRDHHQQFGIEEVPAIPAEEVPAGGRGRGAAGPAAGGRGRGAAARAAAAASGPASAPAE